MRVPFSPPRNVSLEDWNQFQITAMDPAFAEPEVMVCESLNDFRQLVLRLGAAIRPFSIALLTLKGGQQKGGASDPGSSGRLKLDPTPNR